MGVSSGTKRHRPTRPGDPVFQSISDGSRGAAHWLPAFRGYDRQVWSREVRLLPWPLKPRKPRLHQIASAFELAQVCEPDHPMPPFRHALRKKDTLCETCEPISACSVFRCSPDKARMSWGRRIKSMKYRAAIASRSGLNPGKVPISPDFAA